MSNLDFKDIQGIIVRGYGELEAGCYIRLSVKDVQAAKIWLGNMVDKITSGAEKPMDQALNIAFTNSGLQVLGLDSKTFESFSYEFQDGMTSYYRQSILGDDGENAPENWRWGGPKTAPVHILLLLFASDEKAMMQFCTQIAESFGSGGVEQIGEILQTVLLKDAANECNKEHFGFCDGITFPFIEGFGKAGPPANTLKAGEFILGYPNEYGLLTESPMVKPEMDPKKILVPDESGSGDHDLGRNGSYLVFRHLEQHVNRFWQFMEDNTKEANGKSNSDARIALAAKMVGRWMDGTPLLLSPDAENPNLERENDFGYHASDPQGFKCPIGAHIRRANPRDSLDPHPGTEKSIAINKRHQLLRRGRPYGEPVVASMDPEEILQTERPGERGLFFICINANISRQFEFVQQTWINNPKFHGLYNDADPLVGYRDSEPGRTDVFTEQSEPIRRRITGLPAFVTVRGGAYFFLPGLNAVRYLASI